jgi:hypothetical protein
MAHAVETGKRACLARGNLGYRPGKIACRPSCGQVAGALAFSKRWASGRLSSQKYAIIRRPLYVLDASDANQMTGACMTSGLMLYG